ncbi:MAG: SDR family oxidoreductase [Thermodesulfobacteriota bacterium]
MRDKKRGPGGEGRKAALITGGARRLGKAMSLELASMGYDIALHYYRSDPEAVVEEIRSKGVKCLPIRSNLGDSEAASELVSDAQQHLPCLELLINNASLFERAPAMETTDELLDAHIELNLKTPYRLSRDFARLTGEGQIINIIDANALSNRTAYAAYLISKKGLLSLTTMTALEFAPRIRVNGIAPGLILPPPGQGQEYMKEAARKRVPLKRQGRVEDVTRALEYLINNDFITGQILFVDGGEHLR